jgi:hypothetical protein
MSNDPIKSTKRVVVAAAVIDSLASLNLAYPEGWPGQAQGTHGGEAGAARKGIATAAERIEP